ncbi:Pregnancy zone protein [Frankliniella fusca]|uniref:Pregnancy zone protein n=1 Tax=Frankliniella fusca TaxID=407009 RepID=A0AAE1HK94_9NEOP|nr:Pregnancy zone protein [Frankliniella fusca]KAK3922689.1 Pregnancy zone protein [Frankliniella fusca]
MAKLLYAAVLCFCLLQVIMAKPASTVMEACFERHGVPEFAWAKLQTSTCIAYSLANEVLYGKCAGLTDHAQQLDAFFCSIRPETY